MNVIIRPIDMKDATAIQSISTQATVLPYMAWSPSIRIEQIQSLLQNLTPFDHFFVATVDDVVVGYIHLQTGRGRRAHNGSLYVGVDEKYQNKGIGTTLLQKIIDLADHWLFLERLELEVLDTNKRAQNLYERLGFIVEGKKVGAIISEGHYATLQLMCRFQPNGKIR